MKPQVVELDGSDGNRVHWQTCVSGISGLLLALLGYGGPFLENRAEAQDAESMAGQKVAQALKESAQAEAQQYNIHSGPFDFKVGAKVLLGYTDNVFYSETNRSDDFLVNPEIDLGAFMQVSEFNTLKLSLGLGYEYYVKNTVLNQDAPLVNPGTELAFNLFLGDFHIRPYERFSYQESLFYNSPSSEGFFNFNDVGIFKRLENHVGLDATWALHKTVLTAGYDHENFDAQTSSFEYLNRASEWFTASGGYFVGDQTQIGVEGKASIHEYDEQTILSDNWRGRVGPFLDVTSPEKISFRTGGGYDAAQYHSSASESDVSSYYVYTRVRQQTRLFTHSLEAGHENLLGFNANNMRTTYARYSISAPIIRHVTLGANGSVNLGREYGGPSGFNESFTYYEVGPSAGFQFAKHWRTDVGYNFLLKESDLAGRDYSRNRVTLTVAWSF